MPSRYLTVQFQFPDDTSAQDAIRDLASPIAAIAEMFDVEVKAIISHTEPIVLSVPMRPPGDERDEHAVVIPKPHLN